MIFTGEPAPWPVMRWVSVQALRSLVVSTATVVPWGGSNFQAKGSTGFRGLQGELRMSKPLPVIPANSSYG